MRAKKIDTIKLEDTAPIVGRNSRLEQYWMKTGMTDFFKEYRNGKSLNVSTRTVGRLDEIVKLYRLNAVGFGNWVTQEDRYNYVMAMFMAFYDIDKVMGFKKNIGLNNELSITFGARGKGAALAHFEINTFIINITRYVEDSSIDKKKRFLLTGGAGSVAHEYGHALDYYFGKFHDQSTTHLALSGGSITATKFEQKGSYLRIAMDDVMNTIIWKVKDKTLTPYYVRLKQNHNNPYMLSRNEIFARTFEKYVQYKLRKLGIKNLFLNDVKYPPNAYPTDAEMIAIGKKMDVLVRLMREVLK